MRACLPRACDVAAGLRCFGNFLDPRRAATPAGVVLVAKLSRGAHKFRVAAAPRAAYLQHPVLPVHFELYLGFHFNPFA